MQSLRLTSNPALDFVVRQFVSQLIATQGTDGSLGLPLQWDFWGQYHVILGLLRWYEQTGDNDALAACERAADLACARYLNRVSAIATDDLADAEKNQTIAHALTVLYEFTGQAKYLELALGIESDWASSTGVNGFLEHALAGGEFYNGPRPVELADAAPNLFERLTPLTVRLESAAWPNGQSCRQRALLWSTSMAHSPPCSQRQSEPR